MHIFIDESGDIGLDLTKNGTSRYFVMTALLCYEQATQMAIKQSIKKTIKNKVNHGRKRKIITELKGSEIATPIKQYFYNHLPANESWELYSIVVDKKEFCRPVYIKNSVPLYDLFAGYLLDKTVLHKKINSDVVLTMDKSKTSKQITLFNQHIESIFYTKTMGKHKVTINHEASYHNKILQAVDLFSNGIYKKHEEANFEWYNHFENRIKLELML